MRIENGGKKQQEEHAVDDVCKGIVKAVVEHQDDEAKQDAGTYPDYLHTRACGQREDVGLSIRVAGSAHAYPTKRQEGDVDEYRPPVDRA